MKTWLVIVLLFMAVQQSRAHQENETRQHQNGVQQAPFPPAVSQGYLNSNPTKSDPRAEENKSLCQRLSDAFISNWPLVLIGGVGIWAAVRTLHAIEKQVDAMVKSERAWIMVDLEKVPGIGITTNIATRERGGPERYFRSLNIRCICSNQGQTAARIIDKRCAAVAINGDDELPESPNLDIEIRDPVPHYLRANGDPWHGDWNIDVEVSDSDKVQLLIIYGVVRYRHLFSGETVQTTFGYSVGFDSGLKRLIGNSKYNENT